MIGSAMANGRFSIFGFSPNKVIMRQPMTIEKTSGGIRLANLGIAAATKKAAVMGTAMLGSIMSALIQSNPNCRNTPAIMPMTIGTGMAFMRCLIDPDSPRINMAAPAM